MIDRDGRSHYKLRELVTGLLPYTGDHILPRADFPGSCAVAGGRCFGQDIIPLRGLGTDTWQVKQRTCSILSRGDGAS